jgi:nicotinate dehydrogenase subunit B
MHASLGPSAAVALYEDGQLTLWIHSQGVFPQRANIAHVLGMDPAGLHVIYRDGSGCYGHNGADDAALDAALLARALPGRPSIPKVDAGRRARLGTLHAADAHPAAGRP